MLNYNIKYVLKNILENTSFLLVVSLLLSILFPKYSFFLEDYLIYLLVIMMIFSLKNVDLKFDKLNILFIKETIFLSIINYLLLPFIIIVSAFLFLKNQNYINGFILMSAVPCAIIVIPFTNLLKGNIFLSTLGLYINYFLSLIMTPLLIWLFFKENISIMPLLKTIFLLVVLPLLLSRILNSADKKLLKNKFKKYDRIIINLIFVITTYAFIGINIGLINLFDLKEVFFVLSIKTFFLSFLFFVFSKNISFAIFANYKNLGYAIILSLTLFNKETAIPSVLGIFFDNLLFIILNLLVNYVKR